MVSCVRLSEWFITFNTAIFVMRTPCFMRVVSVYRNVCVLFGAQIDIYPTLRVRVCARVWSPCGRCHSPNGCSYRFISYTQSHMLHYIICKSVCTHTHTHNHSLACGRDKFVQCINFFSGGRGRRRVSTMWNMWTCRRTLLVAHCSRCTHVSAEQREY